MGDAIVTVEGLSLWAGGRLVLKDVALALPPTGMTALMGPVGCGKSSLVKWLCGKADPSVYTAQVSRADYFLAPLGRRNRPPLMAQKQGLGFHQIMQALDVMLAENPPLICLDEPTFGLPADAAERLMQRLALIARSRALLIVSHNQREVQTHAQHVILLAGGQVQEHTPADRFFARAQTEAGRHFVGTGWVVLPGLEAPPHHLSREFRPVPQDLGLRPVGCGGRLRAVLGERVFVHDLQKAHGLSRSEAAAMAGAGIRTVVHAAPLSGSEALALLAYGLTGLKLAAQGPADGLPALRALCRALQDALAENGPLVFLRRPEDSHAAFAIALFLVSLGIRADLSAEIATEIDGQLATDPARESLLYDLELSVDLERDGTDPDAFMVDKPDIPWIERQVADRKGAPR